MRAERLRRIQTRPTIVGFAARPIFAPRVRRPADLRTSGETSGQEGRPRGSVGQEEAKRVSSDDLVIIQITWNEGRTVDQKKALYKAIVDGLAKAPGFRPEDDFINLVDVRKENWSVGKGDAQYVYWEGTAGHQGGESRGKSTILNMTRL
jgi:phenylpyruvate tautomerase PptA (4-oxalocrotonate tautomerase family)